MAYRNGTYIAFDALGETNPSKSDFRYYSIIESWASNERIDFTYVNSHVKTYAVRDTSSKETLRIRIRERLSDSKNVLVILSNQTRKSGSMLSEELELAIDDYELPLIVSYTNYQLVADPSKLSRHWPNSLSKRINSGLAKAIHVPFKKEALLDAIQQFNPDKPPKGSLTYYSEQTQRRWGYLSPSSSFDNTQCRR